MKICLVVSKSQGLAVLKNVAEHFQQCLEVITCDDSEDKYRSQFATIKSYCLEENIKLQVLDAKGLQEYLITQNPAVCLVCGWYWLIDAKSLNACELGCFGIHNSLLPAFRGGAPLVWAVMSGANEVGASLFKMTEGIDDGPLIHQWKMAIHQTEYLDIISQKLEAFVSRDIGQVLSDYISGKIQAYPQSESGISYACARKPSDSKVAWVKDSNTLYNECRALQDPYPLLYFSKNSAQYRIRRLIPSNYRCYAEPGKILAYLGDGMLVSCGKDHDGVLIKELLEEGGMIDFSRQQPFRIGATLF